MYNKNHCSFIIIYKKYRFYSIFKSLLVISVRFGSKPKQPNDIRFSYVKNENQTKIAYSILVQFAFQFLLKYGHI